MEIQFSRAGQPDGGKISNFLLEKVCSSGGVLLLCECLSWLLQDITRACACFLLLYPFPLNF